ncbi:YchJ family metal-binding protein [Thaumasiovibrio subtropicus]|uniref:YchJ family metal-binding protein n=1 Tax=Thaumasiovibrio subtropicus TaxID=1891207 RepID=UPI000B350161|nr:YchJ family metal-binding protein [Thaumasiovibrio subtropicus]
MSLCPCGSQQAFADCCQPIISNPQNAHRPEQLMRSRYTAHCIKNVDYVVATYHPSCHAEQHRQAIAESVNSLWLKLDVVDASEVIGHEGYVHFIARYLDNGTCYFLEERSRFLFENGQWYYIDGEYPATPTPPQKIGRNDSCPCESGKKFKKCCSIRH